ncbi:MAG: aminopeptidase [Planctomycetes bacterium]|nr:aminopeptidase [Planctomycetota bacterium]
MRPIACLLIWPMLSGCYLARQACGQAKILLGSRDLTDVYRDPELDEASARKLDLIREAKRFAEENLGLRASRNYTTYFDTGRDAVTYVVSACLKDRFEPYRWWFPIVGSLPYKGFFDLEDAQAEVESLKQEGWDVDLSESAAYSTLGWFRDPVFSSMLDLSDAALAALIIHELVHGTLYVPGRADFNESLATFVGNEGAIQFLERRHGRDSMEARRARRRFEDEQAFDAALRDLFARLSVVYASDRAGEEKLALREEVFAGAREEFRALGFVRFAEGPLDNARLVARLRYGRYNSFRRAYERAHGSWPAFFAAVSAAAASDEPLEAVEALARDR